MINNLVQRSMAAQSKYPNLRFSFTIATLGGNAANSLGSAGANVMTAIKNSNGSRASVTKNLFKTRVKNGILGTFKIDKNGDTNLRGITAYKMHNGDGKTFRTLYPPTKLTKR